MSYNTNEYVCVAQLDRALGYGPRCREFESLRARMKKAFSLESAFLSRVLIGIFPIGKNHENHSGTLWEVHIAGIWRAGYNGEYRVVYKKYKVSCIGG